MDAADPMFILLVIVSVALSVIAWVKSSKVERLDEKLRALSKDLERLDEQIKKMNRRFSSEAPALPVSAPLPAAAQPSQTVDSQPLVSQRDTQPLPVVPFPSQAPEPLAKAVALQSAPMPPAAPPPPPPVVPKPIPVSLPSAPIVPFVQKVVPAPAPLPRPLPPPAVVPPRRSLEDFLGTQLFLKVGVAILVIGLVFAMGLVFQMVGPLGKVLMGYGGGLALLSGGMAFESRERYRTFGRALISGAWGILYFVTFAAGFLEASRVFHSKMIAIGALLLAGAAAVAFSLRYRREWTTVAAFLLIHLSLGIAAFQLKPDFNLSATLIVALAMSVLIWRTGWVRLLGLGVPATWFVVILWILSVPPGNLRFLPALIAMALGFQAALLVIKAEESDGEWLGLSQIGNFLGIFALGLRETQSLNLGWVWALGVGLAHLGFSFAHGRKKRHGLFLLTATTGLAALAFVTPLRLGLKHQLTPLMRLLGLELLLAAGIFLQERYFRILAYVGFSLTFLEILLLRSTSAGPERTLLLCAAGLLFLLNTTLVRTFWRKGCEGEMPGLAWAFSLSGTFLMALLAGLELPLVWLGPLFAATALVWILIAMARGLVDLAFEAAVLSLGGLVFLVSCYGLNPMPHRFMAGGLAVLFLAMAYGAQRLWLMHRLSSAWIAYFRWHLSLATLGGLVALIRMEVHGPWAAPVLLGLGIGFLASGLLMGWSELTAEGLCLGPVALLTALPSLTQPGKSLIRVSHRAWMLGLLAIGALGKGSLLRSLAPRWPWGDSLGFFEGGFGVLGATLLAFLILLEVPSAFIPAALMLQGLVWTLWVRQQPSMPRWGAALGIQGVAFVTFLSEAWPLQGAWGPVPIRSGAMLLALLSAFLIHWMLRGMASQTSPHRVVLSDLVSSETIHQMAGASLVCSSLVLAGLAFVDVPPVAVAATLMALGLVYLLWARWKPMAIRLHIATGFLILGFTALVSHAWWVQGFVGLFPARMVAVGVALGFAFGAQYLLERDSNRPGSRLLELVSWESLASAAGVLLLLGSLALALLIKMEAMARDKNLLVALAWALVGVLFLERQRAVKRGAWWYLGHLWLGAGYVHFLGVNLLQTGEWAAISLRLMTSLPMLGLLVYTYLTWVPAPEEEERGPWVRVGYFYGLQLAVALVLLYECPRAWVVALWALQALVSLIRGLRKQEAHWRRAALILAMATLVRALGVNLYLRDTFQEFRLNWVVLPLAVVFLLVGYVLLNRQRGRDDTDHLQQALGAGTSRFPWFAAQALLLFGFIWVEVSGTALTVWLSCFGLCMVGMGFFLKERVARLTGLGILSACILKLFFYDLRGLSGLPRVLSFSVLGVVLIVVSYTYTRFKERVETLL